MYTYTHINIATAKPLLLLLWISDADVVLLGMSCVFSCVAAFWRVEGSCWVFGRQPQEAETPGPALPTSASQTASSCRSVRYTWKHFDLDLALHASWFSIYRSVHLLHLAYLWLWFSSTMQTYFPFWPYRLILFVFIPGSVHFYCCAKIALRYSLNSLIQKITLYTYLYVHTHTHKTFEICIVYKML